jgi:hypothetical protein
MLAKMTKNRSVRVATIACLLGSALVVSSQSPSGAAPVEKTLNASCGGRDEPSKQLLNVLGSSNFPVTIIADVPPTLEPNAADQDVAFTWKVILDASLTSKATGFGINSLNVDNAQADIAVSGPTATTVIPSGPIPSIPVTLTAGQPATVEVGTFKGTLTEIGSAGPIKYTAGKLGFTINVSVAGKAQIVNVDCNAPGTIASSQIKVPGSPDIVQPIEIQAQPDEAVSVDLLATYVKPGTTKEGETLEVDTTSLKVIDGAGTIVDGKLQATAGAAGSTSSITFEVCAKKTVVGVNEVQTLSVDPTSELLKKGVGFTVKYGEGESPAVDLLGSFLGVPIGFIPPKPGNWENEANNYILTEHKMPTAAELQAALEFTPGIGQGNVQVTKTGAGTYDIEFVNGLGQKDIDDLKIGNYWSVFPQEVKAKIIDSATSLLPGPDTPTTTIPGGLTADQYRKQLEGEIEAAARAGNFDLVGEKIGLLIQFNLSQALASIDINAALGFINSLFTTPPTVSTKVAGESATPICSQGIVDVKVAPSDVLGIQEVADQGATGFGSGGAALAFTG